MPINGLFQIFVYNVKLVFFTTWVCFCIPFRPSLSVDVQALPSQPQAQQGQRELTKLSMGSSE